MNKTAEQLYQEHLYLLKEKKFTEKFDLIMEKSDRFTIPAAEAGDLLIENAKKMLLKQAESYLKKGQFGKVDFAKAAEWALLHGLNTVHSKIDPLAHVLSNSGKINHCYSVFKAAQNNDWEKANNILAERDVDMSSARSFDGPNVISALAMALEAGEFEIAKKLYDAGDRLDDYHREDTEGGTVGAVLSFLAVMHSKGYDFFQNEDLTFVECCKKGLLIQAEKLLPDASQNELDRALKAVVKNFYTLCCRFGGEKVVEFFKSIIAHGGNVVPVYPDLCSMLDNLKKLPSSLQIDESIIDVMENLRAEIQEKVDEISDK